MDREVAARLLALNRQFYQTMGEDFSATRMRLQPGVQRMLGIIPDDASILDMGCGNGELASQLAQRGFSGLYIGLDNSQTLLDIARERSPGTPGFRFFNVDLASPTWNTINQTDPSARFDVILAFSVLHHLPSKDLHHAVLGKVRRLIKPDGRFIHSQWQFLNSPRLRARLVPWEEIGLTSTQVDPGDHLLDWRRGGYGLRYVHHFSETELSSLAAQTGFDVSKTFLSDGEGGNLGLYQIWAPIESDI